jgi:hypothetical protein
MMHHHVLYELNIVRRMAGIGNLDGDASTE